MASQYEQARNDISKLMNGLVAHKVSKREAMQIADSILNTVWQLGYADCIKDEITNRGQSK